MRRIRDAVPRELASPSLTSLSNLPDADADPVLVRVSVEADRMHHDARILDPTRELNRLDPWGNGSTRALTVQPASDCRDSEGLSSGTSVGLLSCRRDRFPSCLSVSFRSLSLSLRLLR